MTARSLFPALLLCASSALAQETLAPPELEPGRWRAWLAFPEYEVPFELDIAAVGTSNAPSVAVRNGPERIPIDRVEWRGRDLVLGLDHYQGEVVATVGADGKALDGVYRRGRGDGRAQEFHARHGQPRFHPLPPDAAPAGASSDPAPLVGRWAMTTDERERDWVATFEVLEDGSILGNTARKTGDLRWLVGAFERGRLRLSTWDGAHTVLYEATLLPDGTLEGTRVFGGGRSRWTAVKDDRAALPDPWTMVRWRPGVDPGYLSGRDLLGEGAVKTLRDVFRGKPGLFYVLGTWCPNCTDQTQLMVELWKEYAEKGAVFVGLAFERGPDPARATPLLEEYVRRHGVKYPVLFGGQAHDRCLRGVDRLVSFPTTVFVDARGKVRGVYTGFRGPASDEHAEMRGRFEALLDELLAEAARD